MSGYPGPLGDPPADLHRRKLPERLLDGPLVRAYRLSRQPLYFGSEPRSRFDAPAGEFGVLYAALDRHCAFIETLGQVTGIAMVTMKALRTRGWARIIPGRPLRMVDLGSAGSLARIGADARLFAGEHTVARRWSKAFWQHPAEFDGIVYPARHDPARLACALFDRCAPVLRAVADGALVEAGREREIGPILDAYGFGLVEE